MSELQSWKRNKAPQAYKVVIYLTQIFNISSQPSQLYLTTRIKNVFKFLHQEYFHRLDQSIQNNVRILAGI